MTISPSLLLPLPDDEIKIFWALIIPHDNYVGVVAIPYCYSKNVNLIKSGLTINEKTFPSQKKWGEKFNRTTYTKAWGDFF